MPDPKAYAGREQTYVKHHVLEHYLERVAYNILSFKEVFVYVDGFSGPWQSENENYQDTSFKIAVDVLKKVRSGINKNPRKNVEFKCLFIEKEKYQFEELNKAVEDINDVEIELINGKFEDNVAEIESFVKSDFSLIFIDPTGWQGFAMERIKPLFNLRSEVLINFMWNYINRFLDTEQPEIADSFNDLFGPGWFCNTPIFDHEENIVGVIDATSDARARNEHTLALVKLASRNVENRLLVEQFSDSLILMFHARHEYLPTTSVALIAADKYGFIEGANANAKSMLTSLNLSSKQHFSEVFQVKFSVIVDELRAQDVIQIKDRMGATVFTKVHPPPMRRIVNVDQLTGIDGLTPSAEAEEPKVVIEKPFEDELLKRTIGQATKSLQMGLPVVIDGDAGSGKTTLAHHIHERAFSDRRCLYIDCSLLTEANFESYLFGENGRLSYFDPASTFCDDGKFSLARGGSIIVDNAHLLLPQIQPIIADAISFEETRRTSANLPYIIGWIFVGQAGWLEDPACGLETQFIDAVSGCRIFVPPLGQRSDFQKVVMALMAEVSYQHTLSLQSHWVYCRVRTGLEIFANYAERYGKLWCAPRLG